MRVATLIGGLVLIGLSFIVAVVKIPLDVNEAETLGSFTILLTGGLLGFFFGAWYNEQ